MVEADAVVSMSPPMGVGSVVPWDADSEIRDEGSKDRLRAELVILKSYVEEGPRALAGRNSKWGSASENHVSHRRPNGSRRGAMRRK